MKYTKERPARLLDAATGNADLLTSRKEERMSHLTPWSLAALVDLGMWNDQIAVYFGVEPEKVTALRKYYGL